MSSEFIFLRVADCGTTRFGFDEYHLVCTLGTMACATCEAYARKHFLDNVPQGVQTPSGLILTDEMPKG